jgi:DNA-binding protein H-NS
MTSKYFMALLSSVAVVLLLRAITISYLLIKRAYENRAAMSPAPVTARHRTLMSRSPAPLKLSTYSFEELLEIKRDVESEVQSRRTKEVESLRAKVTDTAQTLGVSIEELFGLSARNGRRQTKHAKGKQPAKYRGPNGEEWSGRGPAPRWMKPLLVKGKTKQDFLIK